MRIVPTTLLAGVAAVALAGTAFAHTLTVQLPGGATEYIQYSGNVAPQISFGSTPIAAPSTSAPDAWGFGPDSPFALMQQISAQMDREAAAMMNELNQLQSAALGSLANPSQTMQAAMTSAPPGTQSYSFVSMLSPRGVCSQSMQITSNGPGQKPQIVTHSSGNCAAMGTGGPTSITAPYRMPTPAQPQTHTYRTNAVGNSAYGGMLHPVSW